MPSASHRRFAAFYFFYYAVLGAYSPYVARWLDSLGHGSFAIGILVGLMWLTRIIGPLGWGALNAGSDRPGHWLVAGCVLAAAGFSLLLPAQGFAALFLALLVFGLFYNAVVPQFEAMTLNALGAGQAAYGRIRAWGSIGFIVSVLGLGAALDRFGDAGFPLFTLPLLLLLAAAAGLHWRARAAPVVAGVAGVRGLLRQPGVRRFLVVALLMQLGFGAYYVFFTLHMQRHGHGGLTIGSLWALGVVAEVAVFWAMPQLMARIGAARLLGVCLGLTVLRWAVIALFPSHLWLLIPTQLLHALSFGAFHAASMRLLSGFFPGHTLGTGQSVLYALSWGVGGSIGALVAAAAWELGGGRLAFLGAAAVTAVALLIYVRGQRRMPARSDAATTPATG